MLKIYIGEIIKNIPYIEVLYPNLGMQTRSNMFGDRDVFDNLTEPLFEIVSEPKNSDYLLIPHYHPFVKENFSYVRDFVEKSNQYKKKILVFHVGDSSEPISIPNSIIFRMSQYASRKKPNEIIMPAYANDLSLGEITIRPKGGKPTIGFCGWAGVPTFTGRIRSFVGSFLINTFSFGIFLPYVARLKGIYFRKKALAILSRSPKIVSNFIIRKSYSAHLKTISLDPAQARHEYRENMQTSDFILAPKGDGNYSVRFYETLSMGRIPIVIDTDCELPLSDVIEYEKCTLIIPIKDIGRIDSVVSDFYNSLSEAEFIEIQKSARHTFNQYLRIDQFLKYIFSHAEYLKKYEDNK